MVIRRGVVFSRIIVLRVVANDDDAAVEFELGVGGVGRAAMRRSRRQVWRGGGEVVVVAIVEIGGGEGWRVSVILGIYSIIALEHGGGRRRRVL